MKRNENTFGKNPFPAPNTREKLLLLTVLAFFAKLYVKH